MEKEKKLHIFRIKGKDDTAFYDPMTDIRTLLPAVFQLATAKLPEASRDYMRRCMYIFRLRLQEDSTELDLQFDYFINALKMLPKEQIVLVLQNTALITLALYAVYCRRDRPMLSKEQEDFIRAAKALADGTPDTLEGLARDIVNGTVPLTTEGDLLVQETGEVVKHVKELASKLVNADGASWNELASLCDEEFKARNGEGNSTELAALALAYPTYKDATLSVEVEDDDK